MRYRNFTRAGPKFHSSAACAKPGEMPTIPAGYAELRELFSASEAGFGESPTQQQLEAMHRDQRDYPPELERHLDWLRGVEGEPKRGAAAAGSRQSVLARAPPSNGPRFWALPSPPKRVEVGPQFAAAPGATLLL